MGTTYNPAIVTDGLVFCVDAANKRSYPGTGTTWTDLKGGNAGTLTNGPTFSSDNRGVLSFDGTNDTCVFPTTTQGSNTVNQFYSQLINNFTLEFICRPYNTITERNELHYGFDGTTGQRYLTNTTKYSGASTSANAATLISIGTNAIQVVSHADSHMPINLKYVTSLSSINHFTVSYSGSDPSLYINGEHVRTTTITARTVAFTSYELGGGGGTYSGVNADIYMFKAYSRPLTADEIRQNYEATVGRYT